MPLPPGHVVTEDEYTLNPLVTTAVNPTIQNVAVERVIMSYTVPANSVNPNEAFESYMSGTCNITGTPSLTLGVRIGGLTGTLLCSAVMTPAVANTDRPWDLFARIRCVTVGASGTWHAFVKSENLIRGSAAPGNAAVYMDCTVNPVGPINTTVNQDFVVTAKWSVAATGNALFWHDGEIRKRLA